MRRAGLLRRLGRFTLKLGKWLFCLAILGAGGLWLWARNDYSSAAETLPELERQARKLGIPLVPAEMGPRPPVADKDNAAPVYLRAKRALGTVQLPKDDVASVGDWAGEPTGSHDAQLAAHLRSVQAALDLAKEAARRPSCDFHRDYSLGPNLLFSEFATVKDFAKLLTYRGVLEARQGRLDAAISDFDAVSRMAAHMGREPTLIGALVDIAIDAIGISGRSKAATYFARDPKALAQLRHSLENLPAKPSIKSAFRGEAFFCYTMARHLARFIPQNSDSGVDDGALSAMPVFPPLMDRDLVERAYAARTLEYWIGVFELCNASNWSPLSMSNQMEMRSLQYDFGSTHRPSDVLAAILYPVFSQAGLAFVRQEATRRVNTALIDVLIYRAKHGSLPKTLKEAGVTAVDPFTAEPLKFIVEGDTCRVYSVGPDGKDDGGLRYRDKAKMRDRSYGQDTAAFFPAWDGYKIPAVRTGAKRPLGTPLQQQTGG